MHRSVTIKRLLFYWLASFTLASSMYYLLRLVLPGHQVFGALYRMFLYHWEFPLQYIAIPCFFYGIIATLLANLFQNRKTLGRILITGLIIALTISVSAPFGGMLWHFHDMQAGYFPPNWISIMVSKGFIWGLELGWLIIGFSIPYNIMGTIACFFLTKKSVELFKKE